MRWVPVAVIVVLASGCLTSQQADKSHPVTVTYSWTNTGAHSMEVKAWAIGGDGQHTDGMVVGPGESRSVTLAVVSGPTGQVWWQTGYSNGNFTEGWEWRAHEGSDTCASQIQVTASAEYTVEDGIVQSTPIAVESHCVATRA